MKGVDIMKRIITLLAAMLCIISLILPGSAMADAAVGGEYNYQTADFYVVVDAPDYYVNFRYGPGMEYGIKYPINNGEILHVTATSDNYYDGLWWGQVEYNGDWGWISISQTSMIDNPYQEPATTAPEPVTAAPAPEPETTLPAPDPGPAPVDATGNPDQSSAAVIQGIRNTGDLVEDAYYYENVRTYGDEQHVEVMSIPVINLDSDAVRDLNKTIYLTFYSQIQEALTQPDQVEKLIESTYTWNVNGDILSLVIYTRYGGPWHEYTVYNISISEKRLLSGEEVIAAAGWTHDQYQETVTTILEAQFQETNLDQLDPSNADTAAIFDQQLADTISPENVAASMPYLNGDGELCIIGKIGLFMMQNSSSWEELNLVDPGPETDSFYVRVNAAEGATSLKPEASLGSQAICSIVNGQKLCITETYQDPETGNLWGRTSYNGQHGWILLTDTAETAIY